MAVRKTWQGSEPCKGCCCWGQGGVAESLPLALVPAGKSLVKARGAWAPCARRRRCRAGGAKAAAAHAPSPHVILRPLVLVPQHLPPHAGASASARPNTLHCACRCIDCSVTASGSYLVCLCNCSECFLGSLDAGVPARLQYMFGSRCRTVLLRASKDRCHSNATRNWGQRSAHLSGWCSKAFLLYALLMSSTDADSSMPRTS